MGTKETYNQVQADVGSSALDSLKLDAELYFFNNRTATYRGNMNFTWTNGWFRAGRLVSNTFNPSENMIDIMLGQPKMYKESIIDEYRQPFTVVLDHPTDLGLWLANGSNYSKTYSATAVTTTVNDASATKSGWTMTSTTNFNVGDFIKVPNTDATYGGFVEIAMITEKDGNDIKCTELSQAPANGTTITKLKGATGGTDDTDIGIQTIIGKDKSIHLASKLVFSAQNSFSQIITGFYDCVIKSPARPNKVDGGLSTIELTIEPTLYGPVSATDEKTQQTRSVYIYGKEFVVPYESA